MFNYLFPIFCFGVVITGIVLLGLLEAVKQAKDEPLEAEVRVDPEGKGAQPRSPQRHEPRFPVTSRND